MDERFLCAFPIKIYNFARNLPPRNGREAAKRYSPVCKSLYIKLMTVNKSTYGALRVALAAIVAALSLAGCGKDNYNKLLKSGTQDELYRAALSYFDQEKYERTIYLLEMVKPYANASAKADTVAYYLATAYYKNGDHEMSGMLFDQFRHLYTLSPFLEDVEYMYAKGFYFLSPPPQRDQSNTVRGLMAIDEYLERYPNSMKREALEENVKELNQKLHDKAYLNAKSYYKTANYKAAVVALKNALSRYPDSEHREELMYLSVKSAYLLASRSIERLQRDRYLDVMDAYYTFVYDYPENRFRKELDKIQENAKAYMARYADLDPEPAPAEGASEPQL